MMSTLVCAIGVVVLLFFRRLYEQVPLHMDTGYFVSNSTIHHRRWSYRDGWGSWASLCGRLIPEFVYSHLFLLGRPGVAADYKRNFRRFDTCMGLVFAAGVAVLAPRYAVSPAYAFLAAFTLVSLPVLGVFYESCEKFSIVLWVYAWAALLSGVPWLAVTGAALLWIDVFFVKATSWPVACAASAWALWAFGLPVVLAGAIPALLWMALVVSCGQDLRSLLGVVRRHQSFLKGGKTWLVILSEKAWMIYRQVALPYVLVILFLSKGHADVLFGVFFVGGFLSMVMQPNDVWYFTIVLVPALALSTGAFPVLLAIVAVYTLLDATVDEWTRYELMWIPHRNSIEWRVDWAIDKTFEVQPHTRPIFVDGPWTQIYILAGEAYPTKYIANAPWMLACANKDSIMLEGVTTIRVEAEL